jgi:poly(3-hydroxybutyrate) depolymerase
VSLCITEFWAGPGAPVFVFIGGEGQESCSRLTSRMYLWDLAKEHNALLMNVEHRFYGQSYPTKDMSTENLQYLSSQQGLADLARIITQVKTDLGTESSEVVTVGGSYPGNMAAWFKLKYPSITTGSIASSAPLTAKVGFT